MVFRTLSRAVLAFWLLAPPAVGQERPFPYSLGTRDAVLVPVGAGLSLLGDRVTSNRDPLTRAEIAGLTSGDVNGLDRTAARSWSSAWGDRSDWTRDLTPAAAAALTFARMFQGRWRDGATMGVMFAEAYLLLRGVTYTTKGLAGRKRPFLHNESLSVDERLALADDDPQDAYQSFFSGHSSAAFALATMMSTVFTDLHGRSTLSDVLWVSGLSVAGFTAYARVRAGMHYPSDVLVGAAVGTAIGYGVPWLHRVTRSPGVGVSVGPDGLSVRIPR